MHARVSTYQTDDSDRLIEGFESVSGQLAESLEGEIDGKARLPKGLRDRDARGTRPDLYIG